MKVLVVACGHCGVPEALGEEDIGPEATIIWRRHLCEDAGPLLHRNVDADSAVLFLVGRGLERQVLLFEDAKRAGVHPFRIRFLEAWRLFSDLGDLVVHVRAAMARLRAAEGVETAPMRRTAQFRGGIPRRYLFNPLARCEAPLPRVALRHCRAGAGCDLCVQACPANAILPGVPPRIESTKCTSCGLCLPACPTGAIGHPSLDVGPLEIEAEALADGPGRNLLVVCESALSKGEEDGLELEPGRWRILEVPSLGVFRPQELVRLKVKGFERVVGLGVGHCCPGSPGPFAVVAALLERLGASGLVLTWNLAEGPLPKVWGQPLPGPPRTLPSARSLQGLAAALAEPSAPPIALPGRGAGLVSVARSLCTLCGVCAERCPSGALLFGEAEPGVVRLTFDHAACDACGLCVPACPERAIALQQAIDVGQVGRRVVLKEDAWVLCSSCGARVAPRAMVAHIAAYLKSPAGLDLCPECKPMRALRQTGAP